MNDSIVVSSQHSVVSKEKRLWQRGICRWWPTQLPYWLLATGYWLLSLFSPAVVSAHSIAEVLKAPATFEQKPVVVIGEVANVVTRYGESPYTTFDLSDDKGRTLPVFTSGIPPSCKQGDICRVTGAFVGEKTLGTYVLVQGVEAEKVERVSEAEYKTAGILFRKRKAGGAGQKGMRQVYIPQ